MILQIRIRPAKRSVNNVVIFFMCLICNNAITTTPCYAFAPLQPQPKLLSSPPSSSLLPQVWSAAGNKNPSLMRRNPQQLQSCITKRRLNHKSVATNMVALSSLSDDEDEKASQKPSSSASPSISSLSSTTTTTTTTPSSGVYYLILINVVTFLVDKVFRVPFVSKQMYMHPFRSRKFHWYQPLTACFCHADRAHLRNNLFLLLLFGRSVEDDEGWFGLIFSYVFCGIVSNLITLFVNRSRHFQTVSLGASGAVFGLFAVSMLTKLSWSGKDLNLRKGLELWVLGEFVWTTLLQEVSTAASGGIPGVGHTAHISGAAAGAALILGMRLTLNRFDKQEEKRKTARAIRSSNS